MSNTGTANNPLKAALFMAAWALSFLSAMTCVKQLSSDINDDVLIFMRLFFGLMFAFPILARHGLTPLKTKRLPFHILRVIFTSLAIAATYYSYRRLPLPIATTIGFTSPLMVSMMSWVVFKDHMSLEKAFYILLGYTGVVFIANPSGSSFNMTLPLMVAIGGNFVTSLAIITLKSLTKTESTESIMLYTNGVTFLIWSFLAFFNWKMPSGMDLYILPFVGIFGVLSQYCYIKALQSAEASFVSPFEYLRLVFAIPLGYLVFNETLAPENLIGALIIIAGSIGLMFYDKRRKRKEKLTIRNV